MKTKVFLYLWLPLVLVCACVKFQESLPDATADETRVSISVRLSDEGSPGELSGDGSSGGLPDGTGTRSSWRGSPDRVESFVLMAYRGGCLDACVRAHAGYPVSIRLFRDRAYRLYALANVGDFVPPLKESEMEALSLPVGDFRQTEALPMACRVDAFVPIVSGQTLTLTFERLFARLVVHIEKGEWGMLRVRSVRLRQAAAYVHPFAVDDAGFSAVSSGVGAAAPSDLSASAFVEGDAASEVDLQRLNAGDSLVLYVPQNRQGNLLPGNDDPYRRVPDALGEKAGRCTYLELTASPEGENLLTGDALCRIYLGLNAADNFDIPGNAILDLSVFLTERLMGGWGWRIDSRLSWQSGAVTGWLAEGMHSLDDLYVGEVFRYAVRPSEAFLEAIGDDFSRCSLCFRPAADASAPSPSEPDTTLLFSSWTATGDGVWLADAHCRKLVDSGRIRLCLDGNELFDLSTGLTVQVPVFALQAPSSVYINADTLSVCSLDMRDRQGRSLAAAYGFDADAFALEYVLSVHPEAAAPAVSSFSRLSIGPPTLTAPFGTCSIGIFHTGVNPQLSRFLTESLQQDDIIHLHVRDARSAAASSSFSIRTDILPIQVRLSEQGPDSAWTLCVDNPSALPLDWGLVAMPYAQYQYEAVPPPSCQSLPVIQGPGRGAIFANRKKVSSFGVRDSLVLGISPSVMAARCQSCGYAYLADELSNVGLEPGLTFGANCDARLDGKIEWDCDFSGGTPVFCLFASASENWSEQTLYEPIWLRYSAYEDIGQVQVTARFSSEASLPTVSFNTDREADDHLFAAAYYGYINGSVYGKPSNPWTQSPIQFNPRLQFYASSEKMPAMDGQPRLCASGTFLSRYRQILQYEQDSGPQYTYSVRIEKIEYGISIACEPANRIYSPVVSGTLRHARYSNTEGISYYVGSTLTEIVQDMLYLF